MHIFGDTVLMVPLSLILVLMLILPVQLMVKFRPQISLASITDLENIPAGTTVKFRIYAWGGTSSTATFSIGRDMRRVLLQIV